MHAVSVIVPTRDRAHLLPTTLRTVAWQQDIDIELIVIDDGSSYDVRSSIPAGIDAHVERHQTSMGVAHARNHGIGIAGGSWVAFLDDDDLWAPTKLMQQVAAAEAAGSPWVYSGTVGIDERMHVFEGTPPPSPEEVAAAIREYNAVPATVSNLAVRADILRDSGGFDESLMHVADWDLALRLAEFAFPACVPAPHVAYRWHGGNASYRVRELLAEVGRLERLRGITSRRSTFERYAAHVELRAGRPLRAVPHFARAASIRGESSPGQSMSDLAAVIRTTGEIAKRKLGIKNRSEPSPSSGGDPIGRYRADADKWIAPLRG